jgi:hypothetical protein
VIEGFSFSLHHKTQDASSGKLVHDGLATQHEGCIISKGGEMSDHNLCDSKLKQTLEKKFITFLETMNDSKRETRVDTKGMRQKEIILVFER